MRLLIESTRNWHLIWRISQAPEVVDGITDDLWWSQDPTVRMEGVCQLVLDPNNVALLVCDNDLEKIVGCFICIQQDVKCYEIHTLLTRDCRGAAAIVAGRLGIKYLMEVERAEKLVSQCPVNRREIMLFALKCGFKKVGRAGIDWIKHGLKIPIELVSITREEWIASCH